MQCDCNKENAKALIKGGDLAPDVRGTVKFYQRGGCVLVVADIRGLAHNRQETQGKNSMWRDKKGVKKTGSPLS